MPSKRSAGPPPKLLKATPPTPPTSNGTGRSASHSTGRPRPWRRATSARTRPPTSGPKDTPAFRQRRQAGKALGSWHFAFGQGKFPGQGVHILAGAEEDNDNKIKPVVERFECWLQLGVSASADHRSGEYVVSNSLVRHHACNERLQLVAVLGIENDEWILIDFCQKAAGTIGVVEQVLGVYAFPGQAKRGVCQRIQDGRK